MRIHGDAVSVEMVQAAAQAAGVTVLGVTPHGSRRRARAVEVKLSGSAVRRWMLGTRKFADLAA